jgi:hypothetical protein
MLTKRFNRNAQYKLPRYLRDSRDISSRLLVRISARFAVFQPFRLEYHHAYSVFPVLERKTRRIRYKFALTCRHEDVQVTNNSFEISLQMSGLQSGNRGVYSMRFAGGRSQTMQSVTSCSRSSPPMSRAAAARADERKHANGETQALASPSVEETSVS